MRKFRVSVQLKYEFAVTVFAASAKDALSMARLQDPAAFGSGKRIKVELEVENDDAGTT